MKRSAWKLAVRFLILAVSSPPGLAAAPLWRADCEEAKPFTAVSGQPGGAEAGAASEVAFRGATSWRHAHHGAAAGNSLVSVGQPALALKAGVTYTASCWVRAELPPDGSVGLVVRCGGRKYSGTRVDKRSFDWTRFSASFTPAAESANPVIQLISVASSGQVWFDEAALVEGAEAAAPPAGNPHGAPLAVPVSTAAPAAAALPAGEAASQPLELYVCSARGNDLNSGRSRTEALRTLQKASEMAPGGSTITLLPGWYEGPIRLKAGLPTRPTTLRAEKAGLSFVGRAPLVTGLSPVSGMRYVHVAPWQQFPAILQEADTGLLLRHMASVIDAEERCGTYYFDADAHLIYVHASDSESPLRHTYFTVNSGDAWGITLADCTVVDGLTMSGWAAGAICAEKTTGVVIRNCSLFWNGYAILIKGGRDITVRGNTVWGNYPRYDEGAQIHVTPTPPVERLILEQNAVFDSGRIGMRLFGGRAVAVVCRDNLIMGNSYGFWYKGTDGGPGQRATIGNVAMGNRFGDLGGDPMKSNTYGVPLGAKGDTDLVVADVAAARFCDPAYWDYRLQSDSPARGKGPAAADLGAHPFDGAVVFVTNTGDDAAAGTSLTAPWRSLAVAAQRLQPGQTLYVAAETWDEPLILSGLRAEPQRPTRVRIHGKGRGSLPRVQVVDCRHVSLEYLQVPAGPQSGIEVTRCRNVAILHTAVYGRSGAGITVKASQGISLDHCAIAANQGPGIDLTEGCSDVQVLSSLFAHNRECHVRLDALFDYYGNFNAFAPEADGCDVGRAGAEPGRDIEAWRALCGCDGDSQSAAFDLARAKQGDFRLAPGSSMACGGRFRKPIGPAGVIELPRTLPRLDRVQVLSTTRTSANITFWSPGRICGAAIRYGRTQDYTDTYALASGHWGEYETFHSLSLVGLEPDTTYHFCVGIPPAQEAETTPASKEPGMLWSEDHVLTTTREDPAPRTFYVDLKGDDARDGRSRETAWRTLHKAAREAQAGDTVIIASGRYREILRPLQTGTPGRRIIFRAERPLTVFLDGGYSPQRSGRTHCLQIGNKAYITVENLVLERGDKHDNGGYRGGYGVGGLARVEGSAAIDLRGLVMDGRARYMSGLVCHQNRVPGRISEAPYGVRMTDSATVGCWLTYMGGGNELLTSLDHCLSYLPLISTIVRPEKLEVRNCVFHDRSEQKRRHAALYNEENMSLLTLDHNAYVWMPGSTPIYAYLNGAAGKENVTGLEAWQTRSGQDKGSIEIMMAPGQGVYPGSFRLDYDRAGASRPAMALADFVPDENSPLRARNPDGFEVGPRWRSWIR